ncbi:GbpC/Spa domain-containing protein, partial [Streptococcus sobrinus]|uniref:GbpC/Spa domain-containing protein n=1 Tax=Streptococcus sobrinus TaxID=1310 RepID=UPI000367369D
QADNQAARDAYNTAKAEYDAKKAEYDQAKAKYDADKAEYDAKVAEKEAADKANAEAEAKYNADKAQFEKDTIDYNTELLEYETALKQYKNAKEAHDKFLADTGLTQTKNAQELTFLREPNATHTIDGISSYLTKDAQQRLANDGGVKQYESNNLKEGDVVSTSPYANKEAEWLSVKVGDKFSVTYDGLSKSKMIVDGVEHDISKVIYRYEILNLPSNDGKGIAKVDADPTITLTVGASTDKADEPIKVAVDVEFYDENGQMYDLSQRKAIVALNSLNHWDGAAYANGSDKPRELVVEAKDADGNTVRGTWDPYADGSSPSLNNGAPVVKSGYADFDGKTVTISESNPLKIIAQKAGWNGSWIVEKETTVLENYVYASGGGNGHSTGLDEYKFGDQDDVLGTYRIDPTSGLITFTPKKKFQSIKHQEFVNIGDKEFVAIPNSSVTYNPDTKEVTSEKDNQYIEHGAVFNGETTPTLRGWDDADSPYLYYGGAGVKMTDGHLVFTANGANADGQPTVYWFAVNSNVGFPKDPGDAPKAPEKPTPPTPPTPKTVTVPTPPTEPTPPTPPTEPTDKPTVPV